MSRRISLRYSSGTRIAMPATSRMSLATPFLPAPSSIVFTPSTSYGDDHFSSCVSLFNVPHSLRDLTQPVTPVDHRSDLSGLQELAHDSQIPSAGSRHHHDQFLARES